MVNMTVLHTIQPHIHVYIRCNSIIYVINSVTFEFFFHVNYAIPRQNAVSDVHVTVICLCASISLFGLICDPGAHI
jgi:hypothetical protein